RRAQEGPDRGAPPDRGAGRRQACARRVSARRVRRHRQQTADRRGVFDVRRGDERPPVGVPAMIKRLTSTCARLVVVGAVIVAGIALGVQRGEAHKAITSKYTYNDDVFPILRDRCARCHVGGGVAPMSLMTYDEAFPWAESIRAELVASHMPPWNAEDGFGELKHAHVLSPKELDVILTWATGGNPRGALDQKLPVG